MTTPSRSAMALASGTPLREVILSGTAGLTIDQHRAVDVELNAALARGLKESGRVEYLPFMSADGANPTASTTASWIYRYPEMVSLGR